MNVKQRKFKCEENAVERKINTILGYFLKKKKLTFDFFNVTFF